MRSYRRIVSAAALTLALWAAAPVNTPANSLLSGYGGPGAGNQAIIGATLLNGSSGKGGGGDGSTSGSSSSSRNGEQSGAGESPSPGATGVGDKTASRGGASGRSTGRRHAGQNKRPTSEDPARRSDAGNASAGAVRAYPASSVGRARAGAVESETLGLSRDDLLLVLLALAGLAFTGVLTRRLAHTTATGGRHRTLKRKHKGPE